MSDPKHPMQPVVLGPDNKAVFQKNRIVQWLFETGPFGADDIAKQGARRGWSDEDFSQFVQLLGFSVDEFSKLKFAVPEDVGVANKLCRLQGWR